MHAGRAASDSRPLIAIRAGSGLGDAIYLQSVARYFIERGNKVEACSCYGEVFRPLGDDVIVSPFRRAPIDRNAHYTSRRGVAGSTQFEDCCIQAGIRDKVPLDLGWREISPRWRHDLRELAAGKPIVAVAMPRAPFARSDGYGLEMLPDMGVLQKLLDRLAPYVFLVQLGAGKALHRFTGLHADLANRTTVGDLLDVASACDGFLGYCSFFVPLAESLHRPALFLWSRRGLKSPHLIVRQITPRKILHRASSRHVFDDCSAADREGAAGAFLAALGGPQPL